MFHFATPRLTLSSFCPSFFQRSIGYLLATLSLTSVHVQRAGGQPTFAGNVQHTSLYEVPAQRLQRLLWSVNVDLDNPGAPAHYGAPVITASNTVLVPIRGTNGYQVRAYEGGTGRLKYTLLSDHISAPSTWTPVYQPALATSATGTRLYYAGAGGTLYYINDPDSDSPGTPVHLCFYTNLAGYTTNASNFNNTVFINTPFTPGSNGVIYFGFRIEQTAPAPLNTTNNGFVRLDQSGNATYVFAKAAAGDAGISRNSHNCAPALSHDGATVYVAVKDPVIAIYAYLLALDSTNLATKHKVLLRDPRNGNPASVPDISTASPMIAPDGDVYFGVFGNPNPGGRGFLLRYSGNLQTNKTPGGFGWDSTPAIVPTNMVPSYRGTSPYLIFTKYNNYALNGDGDGINRMALLDPDSTQIDPHPSAGGLKEMREVMTVIGCKPDQNVQSASYPLAVREWCINTAAVNPACNSVLAPSEDGYIYRWDLAKDSLSEAYKLGPAVGAPYVPTVIGPDGVVYTLNGGKLSALGSLTNVFLSVYSSVPNLHSLVVSQAVTFTAVVTNLNPSGPAPTGTITFEDLYFPGLTTLTNILAANIPLTNGMASVTTSALTAGGTNLGSHLIAAIYSGDGTFQAGRSTCVQKVHVSATTTDLSSDIPPGSSNAVVVTATVATTPVSSLKPTGMVSFWDGDNCVAQLALNTNGIASITISNLTGSHAFSAHYQGDTRFASSTGAIAASSPWSTEVATMTNGAVQLTFTNVSGAPFVVLCSSNFAEPLSNWLILGPAVETVPGQFNYTDYDATNSGQRFYRIRSP